MTLRDARCRQSKTPFAEISANPNPSRTFNPPATSYPLAATDSAVLLAAILATPSKENCDSL